MQHLLVVCSYDAPGVKTGPAPWVTSLKTGTKKENFKILFLWNWKVWSFDIWYAASPNEPLPSLFKWCPWGQNWPCSWGHKFQHSVTILILVLLKRNNHCKTLSFDLVGYLPSFAYIFPKVSWNHCSVKFPATIHLCTRFSCVTFTLEVHIEGLTSLYACQRLDILGSPIVQFFFRSITLSLLVWLTWNLAVVFVAIIRSAMWRSQNFSCWWPSYLPLIIEMHDIGQNPFHLYSVHRTSVSGERSRANGPLVQSYSDIINVVYSPVAQFVTWRARNAGAVCDPPHFDHSEEIPRPLDRTATRLIIHRWNYIYNTVRKSLPDHKSLVLNDLKAFADRYGITTVTLKFVFIE